jgi:hypothetical protein
MTTRPLRLTQPEEMPAPVVDELSATVLTEAIDALAALRTPYWLERHRGPPARPGQPAPPGPSDCYPTPSPKPVTRN